MNDILDSPEQIDQHIRRYSASIVHVLIHGFRAKPKDEFWGRVSSLTGDRGRDTGKGLMISLPARSCTRSCTV